MGVLDTKEQVDSIASPIHYCLAMFTAIVAGK